MIHAIVCWFVGHAWSEPIVTAEKLYVNCERCGCDCWVPMHLLLKKIRLRGILNGKAGVKYE